MSAKPRLLDRVRESLRIRHYSYRTEQQYVGWIRRFIVFHGRRHPEVLGGEHVESFLSHLAIERHVSAATQSQALAAVLFLYKHVLKIDLPWLAGVVCATRPKRLPVVLTRSEVRRVLDAMPEKYRLIASLMYGSGLRLLETLRLRVKDVNVDQRLLLIRDGKGAKDRVTILPESLIAPLAHQIGEVVRRHDHARRSGFGGVELPSALSRKYPGAHLELGWQYIFPADRPSRDPSMGAWRRHHVLEDSVQRHVKQAVRDAKIDKPASSHTFRHCFATHMLESGADIRTVQNSWATRASRRRRSTRRS